MQSPPAAQYNALAFGAGGFDASGASFSGSATGFEGGAYGVDAGSSGNYGSQFYSSSSSFGSEGGYGGSNGLDLAGASFAAVDTNNDGGIDRAEFQRFVQGGLWAN